jgi:hypothetical protein
MLGSAVKIVTPQQAKLIIAYDALEHLLDIFHHTTIGLDFVRDACSGESVIARYFNLKRNFLFYII